MEKVDQFQQASFSFGSTPSDRLANSHICSTMSILQLPYTLEGVSGAPSAKALGKLSRE